MASAIDRAKEKTNPSTRTPASMAKSRSLLIGRMGGNVMSRLVHQTVGSGPVHPLFDARHEGVVPRPLPGDCGQSGLSWKLTVASYGKSSHRANTSTLLAGRVRAAELSKPCIGWGSAHTPPPLPATPGFTQFSYTSLLKISRHSPPPGKPIR